MKQTMQKLRALHKQGLEGTPPPDKLTRIERIAHHIGSTSTRNRLAANEQLAAQQRSELDQAILKSNGVNKQLFQLIRAAAEIPHPRQSSPARGLTWKQPHDPDELVWAMHLASDSGSGSLSSHKIPLAKELGSLRVDSTKWSHNGFNVRVHDLSIRLHAPLSEYGVIGAGGSTVWINLPSEAESQRAMYDPDKRGFTGGIRIDVGPDGTITKLGITDSSQAGFRSEDPATMQVGLSSFLEEAQQAVQETASLYADLDQL